MANAPRGAVLHQIERLFRIGTSAGLTEWELLRRYLARGDEGAFEALLARHGPMVLGVCRRLLHDERDVEDAFQATFLVLVRRARSLGERDAIGPWLYGVASRVALRARCEVARRGALEKRGVPVAPATCDDDPLRRELGPLLDEELGRLPTKYRAPVVLCYLEGQTHEAAARQLGWPIGTVKGRLVRARELLKGRLTRRGLALSAGALAAALSRDAAAAVPETLRDQTVQVAVRFALGRAAAGAVPVAVASLAEGVLTTMVLSKLRAVASVLAMFAAAAAGAAAIAQQESSYRSQPQPVTRSGPERNEDVPSDDAVAARQTERTNEAAPVDDRKLPSLEELLRQGFHEALDAYREGKVDVEKVYRWSTRLLEVESQSDDPSVRRRAAQAHLDRMKELRQRAQLRYAHGTELGVNVTAAEFYRREAEPIPRGGPVDQPKQADRSLKPVPAPSRTRPSPNLPAVTATRPAPDRLATEQGRGGGSGKDPRSATIIAALEKPVAISFPNETPLEEFLRYIKVVTKGAEFPNGIPIYVDPIGLQEAEKTMTSTVQIDLEGVPLRRTLQLALQQLGLFYLVDDGLLYISSEGSAQTRLPDTRFQPSPIVDMMERVERGELDSEGVKELIEMLKARIEIAKLKHEEALIEAGQGSGSGGSRPPNRQ